MFGFLNGGHIGSNQEMNSRWGSKRLWIQWQLNEMRYSLLEKMAESSNATDRLTCAPWEEPCWQLTQLPGKSHADGESVLPGRSHADNWPMLPVRSHADHWPVLPGRSHADDESVLPGRSHADGFSKQDLFSYRLTAVVTSNSKVLGCEASQE